MTSQTDQIGTMFGSTSRTPLIKHPQQRVDAVTTVGIVIPARNEQTHLGWCLDAIDAAIAHLHGTEFASVTVRAVVVLDSCTDGTAEIAAHYRDIHVITANLGSVGAARALGVDTVLAAATDLPQHVWLANTDADSTVPPNWITHMLAEADRGADLILGTVTPDDLASRQLRQAWAERHVLHDGHPHVHAANLGIRASSYLALGGWPQRVSGEDEDLVRAAGRAPAVRILRTGQIPVITSSRLHGRAPDGFAHYLRRLTHHLPQPAPAALAAQS